MDAKEFENAYAENIILEQAAQAAGEGYLLLKKYSKHITFSTT